jgi:uncharacterized protein YjcR
MPSKPPSSNPPKRKRGGQKGNRNAEKHGFYSRQLRPSEIKDLEEIKKPVDVESEIEMQRVIIRRIMELIDESSSSAEIAALSKAQAIVVNTLNRLIRTQVLLASSLSQDDVYLLEALERVHEEFNIHARNAQVNHEPPHSTHPHPRPRRTTAPMPFRRSPYPPKK